MTTQNDHKKARPGRQARWVLAAVAAGLMVSQGGLGQQGVKGLASVPG